MRGSQCSAGVKQTDTLAGTGSSAKADVAKKEAAMTAAASLILFIPISPHHDDENTFLDHDGYSYAFHRRRLLPHGRGGHDVPACEPLIHPTTGNCRYPHLLPTWKKR
jgi:hypothetical protein